MSLQNAFGNLALDATIVSTNTKLDNILTELNAKFEAGQQVALDAATLAALESITATVSNFPSDFPDSAVLTKLEAIRTLLTNGTQSTKITDGAGTVNTKQLGTSITTSDVGLVTQSVIHGVTTGGGGGYVDVKVTPSGALTTETTISGTPSVSVSNFPATQPVSGTVTANTGLTQPLTNAELRAATVETFLSDSVGNNISVLNPSGSSDYMLEVAQSATDFYPGTGNSSTANLASAATFPGTIENVFNQQAYSILFRADQNCTITIFQYTDLAGAYLNQTSTFSYTANTPFARSGVMNGNYFKVTVTNNGGSTTTVFRLDTAYGTLPSATTLNNAPVSLDEVNGTAFSLGQKTSALSLPVVASSDDFVNGQGTQTVVSNNILLATAGTSAVDVSAYRSFTCQVVSTGTAGTFIFEGSNDNVNFQSIPVYNQALVVRVPIVTAITATASQIIYEGSINFKWLRLRIATTITGGSLQAFTNYIQVPLGTSLQVVSNGTAANLLATVSGTVTATGVAGTAAHSAAVSGNPVYGAGKVAPTTIATVDSTLVAGDAAGIPITTGQQIIIKEGGTSELDFSVPVSSAVTINTVQGLIASSGTASVRNYIKSIRISNDLLGVAGNLLILDSIVSVTSIAITTGLATTGTHDLRIGDAIVFTALAGGTGVTVNQIYYVTTVGSATTFNFSATPGGANVIPSVAYTGTSMYRVFDQIRLQTVAGTQLMTYNQPLKGIANTITNYLIPSNLTSGNVYLTVNGYRGF